MSRSRRKTPVVGWTLAESEKGDKQKANRKLRRLAKEAVRLAKEPPIQRETSNIWLMDKDGKQRFDPSEHPKLMRK